MTARATRVGRVAGATIVHLLDERERAVCHARIGSAGWAATADRRDFEIHAPGLICVRCTARETRRLEQARASLSRSPATPRTADGAGRRPSKPRTADAPRSPKRDWYSVQLWQRVLPADPLSIVCDLACTSLQHARATAAHVIQDVHGEQQRDYTSDRPAAGDAWDQAAAVMLGAPAAGVKVHLPDGSLLRVRTRAKAQYARWHARSAVPCPSCTRPMTPGSVLCQASRSDARALNAITMLRLRVEDGLTHRQIADRMGRSVPAIQTELSRLRAIGFPVPGSPRAEAGSGAASTGSLSSRRLTGALAAALRARGVTP